MPPACISWDIQRVFPLQGRRNLGVLGRAFDLLPGSSMLNARCIHRGIVGVTVKLIDDSKAEIINFQPVILPRGETVADDLTVWQEELLDAFHAIPQDA